MRRSKFTESQIAAALKEADAGVAVAQIARKHGISAATFYQWRAKFGGMEVSDMKRLRELEQENSRHKHMYADLSLDHSLLKELIQAKKLWRPRAAGKRCGGFRSAA